MNNNDGQHQLDLLTKPLSFVRESTWFVLKGQHRYGPFPYAEVVRLLQAKSLQPTDYLWRPENKDWKRLSELMEFAPETLRAFQFSPEWRDKGVFKPRAFQRFAYGASILIHNSQKLFRGRSLEMSLGGVGMLIDYPEIPSGTKLTLHFKPSDLPAFNATGLVASRLVLQTTGMPNQYKYGLKFENLEPQVSSELIEYFNRKTA